MEEYPEGWKNMEIQEVSGTEAAFLFLAHKSENKAEGRTVRAVSVPYFCPRMSQPEVINEAAFLGPGYLEMLTPALHLLAP